MTGSDFTGATTPAVGTTYPGTSTAANADVISCQITTTAAVAIGANVMQILTPSLNAAALQSTSATVTASAVQLVGAVTYVNGSPISSTGTIESPSAAAAIAKSAQGVTVTATPNTSSAQIDLTAGNLASKQFTTVAISAIETASTSLFKLGTINIVNSATKLRTDGTSAYTQSVKPGSTTTVVTVASPVPGFFGALGTSGIITLSPSAATSACAATAVMSSATFSTAASAAAATQVVLPAAILVNAVASSTVNYDVCMGVTGAITILSGATTISATLGSKTTTDNSESLTAVALESLSQNGVTKYVRNYVPYTLQSGTWPLTVRLINTGVVAANPVFVLYAGTNYQNAVTGVATQAGAAQVTLGTFTDTTALAVGESRSYTSKQIETAMGYTPNGSERDLLKITASTNSLDVQTFLNTPTGGYTNISGTE